MNTQSHRFLLLDPQPGEPGGSPAPAERIVRGTNAGDLSADTISALAGDLGLDPALFGQSSKAPAASPSPAATAASAVTPPAAPNPSATTTPAPVTPPAAAAPSPAAAAPSAELTAEQTDWLTQRAAATTPEAAAQLDASAPAFSDEQWALAQTQIETVSREGGEGNEGAELATLKAERDRIKAEAEAKAKRLDEVEAENARLKTTPIPIAPMNPLMAATPEELAQAEREAARLKQWALANWDGTQEVPANGNQPAVPAYTAEQVRRAFARADDQLTRIIPAARTYAQQFEQENTLAQQVYPELFNPQSPHCQTRENILRRLPGLKAGLPQISAVIGDAMVGEQLRGLLLAENPTAETKALRDALVKAAPSLAKFMPVLAGPAKGAARQFKLTAKPIVPLARPSGGSQRTIPRPGKATATAPNLAKFAKAAGTDAESDALLELVKSQMPGIPTIDPKTEA